MTAVSTPWVLGLVADDLTGAADSGVAFAEHGWRVTLHLDPKRVPGSILVATSARSVIAVATGIRALPDDDAAAATAGAVKALRAAGAERLYVKIDSTARGSVAGQVAGALHAWDVHGGAARAVICPAFPEHHRTVVDGHVLVNGIPLERTPAATDPVTPRTTGDLCTILRGAVRGTPADIGSVPRIILDAADDADLDKIATRLAAGGPETIVVGSGGLAAALARCWSRSGPLIAAEVALSDRRVLVAVSSLHPVTAAQLAHLRSSSVVERVDVLTTTGGTFTPVGAAADLADRVAATLAAQNYAALVVVGGDGGAAILVRLSADHVIIDGALSGGCPTGIVVGGTADGLRLVTKSGGFGDPPTLTTITARLAARDGAEHRSDRNAEVRPTPEDVT